MARRWRPESEGLYGQVEANTGAGSSCLRSVAGLSSAADGSGATTKVTATSSRASNKLPRGLRERLDAAVRRGFRKASTPGVVVGVQTPKGT
jgi:hypothetical protein